MADWIEWTGESIEHFTPAEQREQRLADAGGRVIGHTAQGRPIWGVVAGDGPLVVSLLAGSHSDEPVGSETLLRLVEGLSGAAGGLAASRAASACTFVVVPHVNPDGEAANRDWIDAWPDPIPFYTGRFREKPGRDVEFAYPDGRVENAIVSAFLREHGPYDLHLSLHGMAAATGVWHLIEQSWIDRSAELRQAYAQAVVRAGLGLFDWDRGGEKGFAYIGPGFSTTPTGAAMRAYFNGQDDPNTAAMFGDSSMEHVRSLGGDPLCMVTEVPLWEVNGPHEESEPGVPRNYLAFRSALDEMDLDGFEVRGVPIDVQVRLQLTAIELGVRTVSDRRGRPGRATCP